jgi:hypothetical protein
MTTLEVLTALKTDVRAYGTKMLNEAEHATAIGSDELHFAAVTAAGVAELFMRMIDRHARKIS